MTSRLVARDFAFIAVMVVLTCLFAMLGFWQWQRLAEKDALIVAVGDRMTRPPIELPTLEMWPELDPADLDYRPVTVTGSYVPAQTILVFTSLPDARGAASGPGYWVMTPFALESGGAIFVNRGFVPEGQRSAFAAGGAVEPATLTVSGVARVSEEGGSFTPGTDAAHRIDWIRNIDRLARLTDPSLAPFAPVYLDLPAGPVGALPQGGETLVEFPNNHLGYALTWFGFALLTPILLAFWLRRRRAPETA